MIIKEDLNIYMKKLFQFLKEDESAEETSDVGSTETGDSVGSGETDSTETDSTETDSTETEEESSEEEKEEGSSDDSEEETEEEETEEEETERQKAWKEARNFLQENKHPGSIAYILTELFTKPGEDFIKDINIELTDSIVNARQKSIQDTKAAETATGGIWSPDQIANYVATGSENNSYIKAVLDGSVSGEALGDSKSSSTTLFTDIKKGSGVLSKNKPQAPNSNQDSEKVSGAPTATLTDFYLFSCLGGEAIIKDVGDQIDGLSPREYCGSQMKLEES